MSGKQFRVCYDVPDFDATTGFYEGVLGLECVSSWDRPTGKGALYSAGGHAVVEVLAAAAGEAPFDAPPRNSFSIMIEVDDVDARRAAIAGKAGAEPTPVVDKPWNRSFSVRDPDGVEIFFFVSQPGE